MRILLIICGVLVLVGAALFAFDTRTELIEQVDSEAMAIPQPLQSVEAPEPQETTPTPVAPNPQVPEEEVSEAKPPAEPTTPEPTTPEPKTRNASTFIERIDDRSILLDGRFTVRGGGTERDPYAITWDLLGTARSSIDPAEGMTEVPPYLALLDGTWIRISGFYSSPLLAQDEVSELLVSLDSWDGCCIGLPPSPFDCLEVQLRAPLSMRGKHLIRFGTVTGRMKIEPFVVGNWLMGLYRLEDATMDIGSF